MTPTGATRSTCLKSRVGVRLGRSSRFALPVVLAALFLLVCAAQAFAETGHVKLNIVGTGSGEVQSKEFEELIGPGVPPIACSYNGTNESGACENVPSLVAGEPGVYGERLQGVPAPGSELVGWTVVQGDTSLEECPSSIGPETCILSNLRGEPDVGVEWEVRVEFKLAGKPSFKLNLHTSGTGSGSFMCEVNGGGQEACKAEYEEGKQVQVVPHEGAHSVFGEFTSENGGQCSGASCEFTMTSEKTANAKFELVTEALTGSVTGPGKVECKDETALGGFGACAVSYPYGDAIKVKATPNLGAHQTSLNGSGSAVGNCSGSECSFTIAESSGVSAAFALDEESLAIDKPGSGAGEVKCNGGSCAGPWLHGETIEVTATPTGGSTLGSVSGTGSAGLCSSSPCEFAIDEPSVVSVTFNAAVSHPSTLAVFKGGNGAGTVTSSPSGISCGSEPCEAVFEEGDLITLEAHPAGGSVLAGWLGCRHVTATTCQVKLGSSAVEVTAIFLVEGKEGVNGKEGATGKEGPEGKAGKEGTTGKEGATGKEGPEGKAGKEGSRGEIGFPGPEGPQGQAGAAGGQGSQGAQGMQGPAGNPGAMGPQGKQGPAGAAARVSCKVKQQKNGAKTKVTCTVTYQSTTASAATVRVHWSLTHSGHTVRRGTTGHGGRLTLGYLQNGHYRLHIQGQRGSRLIVVG